ncbi:MAG TPA: acyl carrier protein [Solirubrobacterales bacterium]|nr:acyl carrier protein [Solirubrobacterales bacterium]
MDSDTQAIAAARTKILGFCASSLAAYGIDPDAASDDLDLRASGAIDSLGFVELVVMLEESFAVELELEDIDPEALTVLGPLSEHVGAQVVAAKGVAV